jgi:hypothetical protein
MLDLSTVQVIFWMGQPLLSILLFWVVTPCGLTGSYQRFGETYYLHLQGCVGIRLKVHTASQPRTTSTSSPP